MGRAGPDAPPAHRVFHRYQRGAVNHLGTGATALCAGGPVIECAAPADPDDSAGGLPRPRPASPAAGSVRVGLLPEPEVTRGQASPHAPLLRLLGRLGWQRDPDLWTVHCHDGYERRARILVHLSATGICLTVPEQGPLQLSGLQIGQLRAALRDAFLSFALLAGPDRIRHAEFAAAPPTRPPSGRQRVPMQAAARASVAELRPRERGTSLGAGS
ncbi:MAG TPA: hypothetical protein VJT72_13240 [Pseudonocardiaceae bacterium]|nr:hypothetical protein [Pseudonocardiaceae bacterium]